MCTSVLGLYVVLLVLALMVATRDRAEPFKVHVEGDLGLPALGLGSLVTGIHTHAIRPIYLGGVSLIPFQSTFRRARRIINKMSL